MAIFLVASTTTAATKLFLIMLTVKSFNMFCLCFLSRTLWLYMEMSKGINMLYNTYIQLNCNRSMFEIDHK